MAEFRKMSAYVKWLDEQDTQPFIAAVTREKLLKEYEKKTGSSFSDAWRIHDAAVAHNYIEMGGTHPFTQFLVNPEKGYSLIQKRWGIPTGVMRAAFEENKTLIATSTAVIIAVCTVINLALAYFSKGQ